jgi:hypothetical protein
MSNTMMKTLMVFKLTGRTQTRINTPWGLGLAVIEIYEWHAGNVQDSEERGERSLEFGRDKISVPGLEQADDDIGWQKAPVSITVANCLSTDPYPDKIMKRFDKESRLQRLT